MDDLDEADLDKFPPICWKAILLLVACVLVAIAGAYTGIRLRQRQADKLSTGDPGDSDSPPPPATAPPEATREEEIKSQLVLLMANDPDSAANYIELISNPRSPQYAALNWLLHSDDMQLSVVTGNPNSIDRIAQRYSLSVLYYSTNMNATINNWQGQDHECLWAGVVCVPLATANPKDVLDTSLSLGQPKSGNKVRMGQIHNYRFRRALHSQPLSVQDEVDDAFRATSSGVVSELRMVNFRLMGAIPIELQFLHESLQVLDFSNNELTTLPSELLPRLTQLHTLRLNDNPQLRGEVRLPSTTFTEVNLVDTQLTLVGNNFPCSAENWLFTDENVTFANNCNDEPWMHNSTNNSTNFGYFNNSDYNLTSTSPSDENQVFGEMAGNKNAGGELLQILHTQRIWGNKDGDSMGLLVKLASNGLNVIVTHVDQHQARILQFINGHWLTLGQDVVFEDAIIDAIDISADGSVVAVAVATADHLTQVYTYKIIDDSEWQSIGGTIYVQGRASISLQDTGDRLAVSSVDSVLLYNLFSPSPSERIWIKVSEAPVARLLSTSSGGGSGAAPVSTCLQGEFLAVGSDRVELYQVVPQLGGITAVMEALGTIYTYEPADSVIIASHGMRVAVRAQSVVQMYHRVGLNDWSPLGQPINEADSVSMSSDGTWLLVGQSKQELAGVVRLMKYSSDSADWIPVVLPLLGDMDGDCLGQSVSLAVTSDVVVVAAGAPGSDVDSRGYLQLTSFGI